MANVHDPQDMKHTDQSAEPAGWVDPNLLDAGKSAVPFAATLRRAAAQLAEAVIARAASGAPMTVTAKWSPSPTGGELHVTVA